MINGYKWESNLRAAGETSYDCGFCGSYVAPSMGYFGIHQSYGRQAKILICPKCTLPTSLTGEAGQIPAGRYGSEVRGITDQAIAQLYDEARSCMSVNAFTASVMIARKILMNLACQHGASDNLKFVQYVDYLSSNGWVPPNGKKWVDQIRQKGNDANHELEVMAKADAEQILKFLGMLLKFMYELAVP